MILNFHNDCCETACDSFCVFSTERLGFSSGADPSLTDWCRLTRDQPYHYVLSDRDVISCAFCLDGFTILSVTHGDCLTKQLTHRLHTSHNLRATHAVFGFRCYNCMSVIMGHTTTRALAHCISSLQLTSCFVSVPSAFHQATVCAWFLTDLHCIRSPFKICKWLVA